MVQCGFTLLTLIIWVADERKVHYGEVSLITWKSFYTILRVIPISDILFNQQDSDRLQWNEVWDKQKSLLWLWALKINNQTDIFTIHRACLCMNAIPRKNTNRRCILASIGNQTNPASELTSTKCPWCIQRFSLSVCPLPHHPPQTPQLFQVTFEMRDDFFFFFS